MAFQRLIKSRAAFGRDERANVAMMFALTAPVLLFAAGIAVDYSNAEITRSRLNAAADAAALAAVNANMITQTDAAASAAATAMFRARSAGLTPLAAGSFADAQVAIAHPGSPLTRQVTVAYTEYVQEMFAGVFQMFKIAGNNSVPNSLQVSGSATAQASAAANVNFYLLLDNSPSMSLPSTEAGIQNMEALTGTQCAFACHQAATGNGDTAGNLCYNGSAYVGPKSSNNQQCPSGYTQIDNYAMARRFNVTLKLDELTAGITQLMQTATADQNSTGQAVPPVWQFAAYSMDTSWAISQTSLSQPSQNTSGQGNYQLMAMTPNYQTGWNAASQNFGVMEMYANDQTCANAACTSGSPSLATTHDVATNFDIAMNAINQTMPDPGAGTSVAGDKPQEVLFFVTDGVEDEALGGNRLIQLINGNGATNYCNTIKARGIKIAILYTDYYPVTSNSFYVSNVQPFQPNIGTALAACASPGLYAEASIGSNLGALLVALFTKVVQQNPSLTQ